MVGWACSSSPWSSYEPESGTAIVGRVLDPQGRPIQSVQISTSPETDTEFTNADGYFAIMWQRIPGERDQASTVQPIAEKPYQLFVDKSLYLPLDPIPITYTGGVQDVGDIVLTPERIDIELDGFRPTESDKTLPIDAEAPKRD